MECSRKKYVRAPSSGEEWAGVSRHFEQMWNFSNCIPLTIQEQWMVNTFSSKRLSISDLTSSITMAATLLFSWPSVMPITIHTG